MNMKHSYRLLLILIVIPSFMLVIVGCTVSNGDAWDHEASNFTYEIVSYTHDEGAEITGYIGESEWVKIPESIDGVVVSAIASYAFEDTFVTHIKLPNSIRSLASNSLNTGAIKDVSFYGEYAGKIERVIGEVSFYEYMDNMACTHEEDPSEPEDYLGLTFEHGCPIHKVLDVDAVNIPGEGKYYSYTVVVDLRYYERHPLESFNAYAFGFNGNDTLKRLELNDRLWRVTNFDEIHFPALEAVYVPEDNPHLQSLNGIVYDKAIETLLIYPENHPANTFHVEGSVVNISPSHFRGAIHLEAFSVSEDNLAYKAQDGVLFNGDLTQLIAYPPHKDDDGYTMPDTVELIWRFAFYDNAYLTHLSIPAFATVSHPHRIYDIFHNLTALEAFEVDAGNETYYSLDGVLFSENDLLVYPLGKTDETYHVPSFVESIGTFAFRNHSYLKHIHINQDTEIIGWGAFLYAQALETVTFASDSKLDEISHHAFNGAIKLTSIELPNQLFEIGMNAFRDATSLETLVIPDSVFIMGSHAFYGASTRIKTPLDEPANGWEFDWNPDDLEVIWSYAEED